MNILFVTQRFFPVVGGAENIIKSYADYFSKDNEVTIFTSLAKDLDDFTQPSLHEYDDDQFVYTVKRFPIMSPSEVSKNWKDFPPSFQSPGPFCPELWNDLVYSKPNFDLIIASAFPYDHIIPAVVCSRLYDIPLIIIPHIHAEFKYLYLNGFRLSLLDSCNAVVTNTNFEKKLLVEHGISSQKIFTVPLGIDTSSPSCKNVRNSMGISEDHLVVLFIGRKTKEKGVFNLINAINKIKNQKIVLILVGDSTKEFDEYASSLQSINKIINLGFVTEKEKFDLLYSCDVLALPSKTESFGLVYLESWLLKKPVIGCKIPAVSEIIDHNVNGLLVDFDDVSSLSHAIELMQNPKLRKKLGQNGYKKLVEDFQKNRQLDSFKKICDLIT